jgi:Na+-transporting methylmalonyl-CoA/oxaloacetate decarboxylase gamma subunit
MNTITASLIITVIGMGLVFVGVFALWALMEIVVRVTAGSDKESSQEEEEGEEVVETPSVDNRKKQAAAAAVAFALAFRQKLTGQSGQTENNALSAWQSVRYASRLSRKASLFNRMK